MLDELATILTPDTILRWHREQVARHWDDQQISINPSSLEPQRLSPMVGKILKYRLTTAVQRM